MGCMGTLGDWESSQEVGQAERLNGSESSHVKSRKKSVISPYIVAAQICRKIFCICLLHWHKNWELEHIVAPSWTKVYAEQNNVSWSGINLQYLYRIIDSQTHNALTCWLLISSIQLPFLLSSRVALIPFDTSPKVQCASRASFVSFAMSWFTTMFLWVCADVTPLRSCRYSLSQREEQIFHALLMFLLLSPGDLSSFAKNSSEYSN